MGGTAPLTRRFAPLYLVGSPRVSVNQGSRYRRRVLPSAQGLNSRENKGECHRNRHLRAGNTCSNSLSYDLFLGFSTLRRWVFEVAGDDFDAAIEVVFEQLDRALDISVMRRVQQRPVIVLGQFAQAHGLQVETQEAFFFVQAFFDQFQ